MTCVPLVLGIVIYSGMIVIKTVDILHAKAANGKCIDKAKRAMSINASMVSIISSVVVLALLYFLCKYRYEKMAWAVIIAPVIVSVIMFFSILYKLQIVAVQSGGYVERLDDVSYEGLDDGNMVQEGFDEPMMHEGFDEQMEGFDEPMMHEGFDEQMEGFDDSPVHEGFDDSKVNDGINPDDYGGY
jgi:hypothetical protein